MPGTAPKVLAVVSYPGRMDWLEQTLQSLADQEYSAQEVAGLDVVVLFKDDPKQDQPALPGLQSRVNAILPSAVISEAVDHRAIPAVNYTRAVNNVCAANIDAHYLLLLRDGVVLDPDALRALVGDAVETEAGVVGPKLIDRDQHDHLADVGGTVDRLGVLTPAAMPGELDQSQYDSARDVFVAPIGAMLIRTDTFRSINGFDPIMNAGGAHVDLCWRVQMSARRVRVIPTAIGYQPLEATFPDVSSLDAGSLTADARSSASSDALSAPTTIAAHRILYSHRIRTFIKCYGWVHLLPAFSLAVIVGLIQLFYALARGRFGQASDIATAWLWNLHHAPSLFRQRRRTQRQRVLRDAALRRRHLVSSRRVEDWARSWLSSAGALTESARAPGGILSVDRLIKMRAGLVVWSLTLAVLAFGSRHLISRGVASFGQFADFASTSLLIEAFWGGWREVGAGAAGVGSSAIGLLSVGSLAAFGAVSLLRHLLIIGLIPLGLLGIWRLTKVVSGSKSRLLAVVLYALNPLPFAALTAGAWDALLLYATLPFVFASVIGLADPSSFVVAPNSGALRNNPDGDLLGGENAPVSTSPNVVATQPELGGLTHKNPSELRRRGRIARVVRLALLIGVVAAFEPLVLVLAPLAALALALVGALYRRYRYAIAVVAWTLAACVLAGLVNVLWAFEFDSVSEFFATALSDPAITEPHSLIDLLRFEIGALQVAWLGWGLLLATVTAALITTGRKTFWAFSGLALAAIGFGLAWSAEHGWIDSVANTLFGIELIGLATTSASLGRLTLVMAVIGCCWAIAVGSAGVRFSGLSSKAGRASVPATRVAATGEGGYPIGFWAQRVALLLLSVGVAAAVLPTLVSTRSGDWEASEFDLEIPLSSIDDRGVGSSYRVLWVGQPEVLPLASRSLADGDSTQTSSAPAYTSLYVATSVRGFPDVRAHWPGPITPAEQRLLEAIHLGLNGETLRMGRLLGAFGIRYVVVVNRSAPSYAQGWERPPPAAALNALESQIDLLPVATDTAVRVFRNEAWWPSRAQFIPPVEAGVATSQLELIVTDLTRGVGVLTDNRLVTNQRGQVGAGQVLVAESFDNNWRLETTAGSVRPELALGWSMSFESPVDGPAQLLYDRPEDVASAAVAQVLLWIALLWLALGQPTPFVDRIASRYKVARTAKRATQEDANKSEAG